MRKILNYRFTYFPVIGLILGISSCLLILKQNYLAMVLTNAVILPIFCFVFYKNVKSLFINLLIFVIAFVFGYLLLFFFVTYNLSLQTDNGIYRIYGKVSAIEFNGDYNLLRLKDVTLENGFVIKNLKIILNLDSRINVEVGDCIDCFAETEFLFTDYNFENIYYMSDGVTHKATALDGVTVISGKKNLFELVNLYIKNAIFSNMPKDSAGVAYALLVGNCSYIPNSSYELYKSSGLFHIFSVSGMHISFIAHVIQKLTNKIPVNRVFINVPIILLLFFYCGVCGFAICAIRAALMYSFMLICECFGKKYDVINSILLSFIVTLLINPYNLLDVGCLLSYASVLGLVLFTTPIKNKLKFLPNYFAESLAMSVSATLASMPILLYVFGEFAPIAILYNLIVVPLIYVVFLALIIFVILTIVFKRLILFKFCDWILNFIDWLLIVTKPEKFLIVKPVNYYFMFPYYSSIICLSGLTLTKPKIKYVVGSCVFTLSIILMFI